MFGLVISPRFLPDRLEVDSLKPAGLRSILYTVLDCDRVASVSPDYVVTVNNECQEVKNWAGWDDAIKMIADRPIPPRMVCVGNEFDLFWQHNANDVPPSFAADLVHRAAAILRPYGILTAATSVASAVWPEYLRQMADLCHESADVFDIHPYGQRPNGWGQPGWMHGDLDDTMRHAASLTRGKPLICSEIGVKVGDAGGEEQVAYWMQAAAQTLLDLTPAICTEAYWFAWIDQVGAPHERGPHAFGLRREDGSVRPAHSMFKTLPQGAWEDMPMFTVGQGVLDQMARFGDQPATDEIYHPYGAQAGRHQYSETFGASGRRYVYIFATHQTVIYEPEGV